MSDRTNLGNGLADVWGVWGGAHGIPSRRSVPHYLLAFLAASLLGRRSSAVSSATARRDGQHFAREVSQVETPGAATVAGPSEAKGASPTSHQYDGGSGNLPARKFIFHPAPSPDFRGQFAEAQRGETTKAAVQIDARPADVNRCGAMEPLSAIQPATQKTHRTE